MKSENLPSKDLRWLSVDWDGTVIISKPPDYKMLRNIKGAPEALRALDAMGWKIIIHTARPWGDYIKIERWCKKHNIPARRIVCGKLLAKHYIDDRNLGATIDWTEIVNRLSPH